MSRASLVVLLILTPASVAADDAPRDRDGEPLPEGAVARLGSTRLRHSGLRALAFLPGGASAISAGDDGVFRVWDLKTGRLVRTVPLRGEVAGDPRQVYIPSADQATFSADGGRFAAWRPSRLQVWDTATGELLRSVPCPVVSSLRFSADGRALAAGGAKGVLVWEADGETPKEIPVEAGLGKARLRDSESVVVWGFTPRGDAVFAGGYGGVGMFDVASGRSRLFVAALGPAAVSFGPGRLLIRCGEEQQDFLRWVDPETGKETARHRIAGRGPDEATIVHGGFGTTLAVTPDGRTAACHHRTGAKVVVDGATGETRHRLPDAASMFAFAPDGKTLLFALQTRIVVWDAADGKEVHPQPNGLGGPGLAVSPDGRRFATVEHLGGRLEFWDLAGGAPAQVALPGRDAFTLKAGTFTPDGGAFVAVDVAGFVHRWDVATGERRHHFRLTDPDRPNAHPEERLLAIAAFPPGGLALVAVVAADQPVGGRRVLTWDRDTGKLLARREVEPSWWVHREDLSLNAGRVAGGYEIRDVEAGLGLARLKTKQLEQLGFSPDGRLLAAWGPMPDEAAPPAFRVWEVATGRELVAVPGRAVRDLAFLPGGRVATTDGRNLRVHDLETGRELRRRELPLASNGLRPLPDGRLIVVLTDRTALVYDEPAARKLAAETTARERAAWWDDLGRPDAGPAWAASRRLAEAPEAAVELLAGVRPAVADGPELRRLVARLDDDDFDRREAAQAELRAAGLAVLPALRRDRDAARSPEVRTRLTALLADPPTLADSPDALRRWRAVGVLEAVATPAARRLLAALADGATDAPETRAAAAALRRLAARP